MGLRSHPTGSSTLETPTRTFSLFRSDKPVFTTTVFRPSSPCHPTQAMVVPVVSHIRNPYLTSPGRVHDFHRRLDPGLGILKLRVYGPVPNRWNCSKQLHVNVLELRAVILALRHWVTILQGHHVLIATDNTTVAAYINKRVESIPTSCFSCSGYFPVDTDSGHNSKNQTYSGLPECNSRPTVSAEPAHHDRVESPPRSRESDIHAVGELQKWTCLPQSTTCIFPSSCLPFRSLEHCR